MRVLKELLEDLHETYIILDALDECMDRQELLNSIEEIQGWEISQLHLLLISRRLKDIEDILVSITDLHDRVSIQSSLVDEDIRLYIQEMLENDRRLKRWRHKPLVQEEIKATLMGKADGM